MTVAEEIYVAPSPSLAAITAPKSAARLAGGWAAFDRIRTRAAGGPREQSAWSDLRPVSECPPAVFKALTSPRPDLLGMTLDRPRIMGVINVTPDSFSDGGAHFDAATAVAAGLEMAAAGADILDVGGESTRPGATPTPLDEELRRVLPVIEGLVAAGCRAPISIDTRKARVAREAFAAGARIFNDISGLTHDPGSLAAAAELTREHGGWLCLMHSQGEPQVMQKNPRYDDVALDVYDALAERVAAAVAAGADPARLMVDPGIGFGKTAAHNHALLRQLALFHGLGAPILLGVSRKRFIGAITGEQEAARRGPGSVAAALFGIARGAQIVRVHDVRESVAAARVWTALSADLG